MRKYGKMMQCVFTMIWFVRRNPIKMMKKPHLGTSQGPGWMAQYSVEWGERTGRGKWLLSLSWQEMLHLCDVLVMITAAGNNKSPTLRNYWPASLTLDKSNNAHYPHVPLYGRTSEGAEAADEISCAGSWVGRRLWLTGGRLPARLCDGTAVALSLSRSLTPDINSFIFLLLMMRLCALGTEGEDWKVKSAPRECWQQLGFVTDWNMCQRVNTVYEWERGRPSPPSHSLINLHIVVY